MAGTVYHDCACCGGDAGQNYQWPNQDFEYGVCGSCAVWIAQREGWESVFECYGKPGVHWQLPHGVNPSSEFYVAYEKQFNTSYPLAQIAKT